MNQQVQYRIELLKESMQISGQLLLIKMHIKTVSLDELNLIQMRASILSKLIKETRS